MLEGRYNRKLTNTHISRNRKIRKVEVEPEQLYKEAFNGRLGLIAKRSSIGFLGASTSSLSVSYST